MAASRSSGMANYSPDRREDIVFDVDGDPSTFPRVAQIYLALLATPPPDGDDPSSFYRLPPPFSEDSLSFLVLVNEGLALLKEKRSGGEG